MKVGDRVKMSHPGKRNGEIGTIKEIDIPLETHTCNPCTCGVSLDVGGETWKMHKNWVEPAPRIRTSQFIEVHNTDVLGNKIKSIFVPRPESFFGGWARHQWLKSYFKQECSVASPEFWKVLVERHGLPKVLIEKDGEFREVESSASFESTPGAVHNKNKLNNKSYRST